MKKSGKNESNSVRKLATGAPRAVVMSILIHAGMIALAAWVVVAIIPAPEPQDPITVDTRPRPIPPKPPKPPVPFDKSSSPPSPEVITSDVENPEMSDLSILETSPGEGDGDGIGDGLKRLTPDVFPQFTGDYFWPPDVDRTGNDLEGTYYDFKRNREGTHTGSGQDTFRDAIRKFLSSDWNTSAWSKFYRSPEKRYPTHIMVPTMSSSVAPTAFGEDPGSGYFWVVHCKGEIVYREDITFRFWGVGDEILAVRLDKKVVFADIWHGDRDKYGNFWRNNDPQRKQYFLGYDTTMEVGDWVTLKANEPVDIEIIMGDNGGLAALMLLVEVKGVEYERNDQGGPILPIFKTSSLTHDQVDRIYKDLAMGDACITNGPVFKDF